MTRPTQTHRRNLMRVLDGRTDRLPTGGLVLTAYVALAGVALGLASLGGWLGLITIACLHAIAIGYLARAASWTTHATRDPHELVKAAPPAISKESETAGPRT